MRMCSNWKVNIVGGNINGIATLENWIFLRKLNITYLSYDRAKNICVRMFIGTLITIFKNWKQPQGPLTGKWKKMCSIHSMDYFSATKRNRLLIHTAWVNLRITMLSKEVTHVRVHALLWFSLHEILKNVLP